MSKVKGGGFNDPEVARKAGAIGKRGKSPFNAEVKVLIGNIITELLDKEKFYELYKTLQPKDKLEAIKVLLPYVVYLEKEIAEEATALVGGGNNITVEFITTQKDNVIEIKNNEGTN